VRDDPLEGPTRETYRTLQAKLRGSRGFFLLPGDHGPNRGVPPAPERLVHDDWDHRVRVIGAACQEHGTKLLIRFMPIARENADARDWSQLERWANTLDDVTVAQPMILPYPPERIWDGIHLNSAGVEHFMQTVSADVQPALSH
jgi:hypothetical protein